MSASEEDVDPMLNPLPESPYWEDRYGDFIDETLRDGLRFVFGSAVIVVAMAAVVGIEACAANLQERQCAEPCKVDRPVWDTAKQLIPGS